MNKSNDKKDENTVLLNTVTTKKSIKFASNNSHNTKKFTNNNYKEDNSLLENLVHNNNNNEFSNNTLNKRPSTSITLLNKDILLNTNDKVCNKNSVLYKVVTSLEEEYENNNNNDNNQKIINNNKLSSVANQLNKLIKKSSIIKDTKGGVFKKTEIKEHYKSLINIKDNNHVLKMSKDIFNKGIIDYSNLDEYKKDICFKTNIIKGIKYTSKNVKYNYNIEWNKNKLPFKINDNIY